MERPNGISRRDFVASTAVVAAGVMSLPLSEALAALQQKGKTKVALVGTGVRGVSMYGRDLARNYGDHVQFVALCDINKGRLEYAKQYIGITCPLFTDVDRMLSVARPDVVVVTTVDGTHHEIIIKALEAGCDVITEKPLTTDEVKLNAILDARRRTNKRVIVTFNYRYSPHRAKIKELLMQDRIGRVTSVDFHWYLDVYHGADYFRRWHRLREQSGSLLVHKATHHFDLLNWWIDSDPQDVHAFGDLEFYGRNNEFRHTHCRPCPLKDRCKFYWDMTKNTHLMNLYASNEKYDGYVRDGCVWREDIDIFDKMAVQIKYANNVQVSYSLTAYSPYEGYRIAFNGTRGRLEAWVQERQPWPMQDFDELRLTDNFGDTQLIKIDHQKGGHGGGDARLLDKNFKDISLPDPLHQSATVRDGATSVLIGIAARKSIDIGMVVKIADLTQLEPREKR
ncbi:MAG: Gfo/Idh/MocA family oxidoreductase [Ignavibacteriales bacterium]|nr:Gfo/Idh/MocA family oxidoreductase [Ignavibacteriales bacterium]